MKDAVIYIHGKGDSAAESAHYRPLFPDHMVTGLDYQSSAPWEAGAEIRAAVEELKAEYADIVLIANSIGAYFSMCAGIDHLIRRACFISPIVDMEKLIADLMHRAQVSEAELKSKGIIRTAFGEDLSWEYLCYVRDHPIRWTAPTRILYGSRDGLTPPETIRSFAEAHHAALTVMEGGEHWFHTEEQMRFLDKWILRDREEKKTMKFKGTLIVVKDCKKALKFYQDMFGFELIRDHDGNMELSGNLYLQEETYWERFTGRRVIPQCNHTELYFEEPEIDSFVKKLERLYPDTEYVNRLMTHSWGQRVVRFYDPDGNLIEVGTPV